MAYMGRVRPKWVPSSGPGLYESIKQGAKAVTRSVNSLFRKLESNVLENEAVSLP